MVNMVKRQHFLPNFILKRWSIKKNDKFIFKVFDKNKNAFDSIKIRSQDDPFFSDYFYELNNSGFSFNEIEHKLGEIEKEFYNITQKILDNVTQYKSIRITRKELLILKIFICLQIFRSNDSFEKSKNLDGDFIFNCFFRDKDYVQIKEQQLQNIDFLYYFFKKIENEESLLKVFQMWKYKDTLKYFENEKDAFSSERIFKQLLEDTFISFLEINSELAKGKSFILTDSVPVHAAGFITSIPLVNFYPLTPNICIALINLKFEENEVLNQKILLKLIPELWIEKELFNDFYDDLSIWKRNYRQKWIEKYVQNYNDLFIYEKRSISYDQIKLINSLIYSQNKSHILYLNKKDVQDIDSRIYRIEEANR